MEAARQPFAEAGLHEVDATLGGHQGVACEAGLACGAVKAACLIADFAQSLDQAGVVLLYRCVIVGGLHRQAGPQATRFKDRQADGGARTEYA